MLLLFCFGCSHSEQKGDIVSNPQLDSIKNWIKIAQTAKELPFSDREQYLEDALEKVLDLKNDTLVAEQLSNISLAYKNLNDSLDFRKTNKQVFNLATKANLFDQLGYSHWDLGDFLQSKGVLDSSFYHYKKALASFERLPVDSTSKSLRARMLYSMGRLQDSFKDYLGAEINITSALKIFDELGDNNRIHNCYNVLGVIANGMDDSQSSIVYYEKASEYLPRESKNKEQVWANKNNIASALMNMGEYKKARIAYTHLLEDPNLKQANPKIYAKAISSLAYTILKSENNYEEVEQLLDEAINVNNEKADLSNLARINQFYAELLAKKGDTAQAIKKAQESFSTAKETYNNDRSLEVLKLLGQLDIANAKLYFEEYSKLNEAVQEEERTKRDKFARIRLETDEVIEKNEILTQEKQVWVGAAFALILFGAAFLIIVTLYINNNRLKFRQKQQESNQEIYNLMLSQQGKFEEGKQLEQKRISEELHDGILGEMLGIRLILSGLNEREDRASVAQRADLIEKLRDVEEEIRTISHELNNASYEKFHNFIVSLEDLINGIQSSSGISCSFSFDNKVNWDNLLGDIKINAYRIVQEALKNCVKHAKSKHVDISFESVGNKLKLTIADDGVGFDLNKGKRGIGLRNIISRAKKIHAALDIDSKKGQGTTIILTIPAIYIDSDAVERKEVLNT
ncbi:MAG: ATP-binding protein [Bacteroidota bacterium]|nr:ATP-binding protein [Bacteroidota bacterium]